MKCLLVAFGLITALSGCSGFLEKSAEDLATAADTKLRVDVWNLCQAESVGAVRRAYGGSAEAAQTYNAFCAVGAADQVPLGPATPSE